MWSTRWNLLSLGDVITTTQINVSPSKLYITMTNTEGCKTCVYVLNGNTALQGSLCVWVLVWVWVYARGAWLRLWEIAVLKACHVCEGERVCLLIARERKREGGGRRGVLQCLMKGKGVRRGFEQNPSIVQAFLLFFLSSISLPPTSFTAAPQSCLTLTADAHCSGK